MTAMHRFVVFAVVAGVASGCAAKRFTSCREDGDAYILTSVVIGGSSDREVEQRGQVWRGTYDPNTHTMTCRELGANR